MKLKLTKERACWKIHREGEETHLAAGPIESLEFAQLCLAAPKMLEALDQLSTATVVPCGFGGSTSMMASEVETIARAAIAAARAEPE